MSADAKTLLQRIHAAGLTIELDGADLLLSPADKLTEWQRAYVRRHKAEILEALRQPPAANDHVNAAPAADLIHWRDCTPEQLQNLWARVKAGQPVQIYSATLGEAVWWCRDEALADELKSQGINEAIYAVDELRALAGQSAESLRDAHQFKRPFGATLMSVTAAQPEPAATTPGSDSPTCTAVVTDPLLSGEYLGKQPDIETRMALIKEQADRAIERQRRLVAEKKAVARLVAAQPSITLDNVVIVSGLPYQQAAAALERAKLAGLITVCDGRWYPIPNKENQSC